MAFSYTEIQPVSSFGGSEEKHMEECFLLSQSQHVLANDDIILVSMLNSRNVRVLNRKDGSFKMDVGQMGFRQDDFEMAAGMTFFKDDQILVADLNGNKIMAYSKSDFSFLSLPLITHGFDKPNCVRTDNENNIYVGEVGDYSRKLRCFDSDLNERFVVSQADGFDFLGVNYVSCDIQQKRIILTDSDNNGVHVYKNDGTFLFSIWKPEPGAGLGQLTYPTGTAVDSKGNILVCDTGNSRIQVFDSNGQFLSLFGNEDMFTSPFDVYVTDSGEVVVVDGSVCSGWSRVQIFKY